MIDDPLTKSRRKLGLGGGLVGTKSYWERSA